MCFYFLVPTLIAISRTCDYHHHYQDVTVGSILGLSLAYVCYRLHYPKLSSTNSHLPLECIPGLPNRDGRYCDDTFLPIHLDQTRVATTQHKYTLLKTHGTQSQPFHTKNKYISSIISYPKGRQSTPKKKCPKQF